MRDIYIMKIKQSSKENSVKWLKKYNAQLRRQIRPPWGRPLSDKKNGRGRETISTSSTTEFVFLCISRAPSVI